MFVYDPLQHPFELPIQKMRAHCIAERPLLFQQRQGSTPGTTLAGAFGTALWPVVCAYKETTEGLCNSLPTDEPHCHHQQECILPWLYKPYSIVHRRNFARPVLLRAAELEGEVAVETFNLEVTLWGRHAIAARSAIKKTLQQMGRLGLNNEGQQVHFSISEFRESECLTLKQHLERIGHIQSLLLEFQTPFLHQERTIEGKRQFHTERALPIVGILGNVAYNLVAWDIEDRELGEEVEGKTRHNLARLARDEAWSAAEKLVVIRTHLSAIEMGERYSRGNKKLIPLQGFVGLAEVGGDLKLALPWLVTLALAGGGQKRAMGFGSVRMWTDSILF